MPTGKLVQTQVFVVDPAFQKYTLRPADPTLLETSTTQLPAPTIALRCFNGGVFLGEGGFHAANVQNIGYLPVPAYLCAMAAGGEISKLDSKGFL